MAHEKPDREEKALLVAARGAIGLRLTPKRLLWEYAWRAFDESPILWYEQKKIADSVGCCQRTLQRGNDALKAGDHIRTMLAENRLLIVAVHPNKQWAAPPDPQAMFDRLSRWPDLGDPNEIIQWALRMDGNH